MSKTVLFQTINISISTQFSLYLGTAASGQCEPESDANKEVLRVPQSFRIEPHHHQIV